MAETKADATRITPELELAKLLDELHRRESRDSLSAFSQWVLPEEIPARHHKLIIQKLEAVERGEIKRLMIFAPPGSAKSTYASVRFPSWYLGKHPKEDIICASHTATLAERFGRRVRNIVASEDYRRVFDVSVSTDNAAIGNWSTNQGGEYYAIGVGGGLPGRRANGAVVDDPYPGRDEANSENYRNKVWEWWKADLWPRLKPTGWIVLILTRYHVDDIAGKLLDEMKNGGEKWEVLRLPFFAEQNDPLGREEGERLWPEWFTENMGEIAKRDTLNFASLYQQTPILDSGGYFQRDWIRRYQKTPEHMHIYGASDYAVTEEGDYTVHLVAGVDENDDLYLLDLWRGKATSQEWIEEWIKLVRKWKPLQWAEEKGQIEKSVGPFIDKRMTETRTYTVRRQYASTTDKPTRGQSIRGRVQQGKVLFPYSSWADNLILEMLEFPVGKHDDMVDSLSLLGRMLEKMTSARAPKKKEVIVPKGPATFSEFLKYADKFMPKRERI